MFAPIPRPPPVTTALGNGSPDLFERVGVLERREIAWILAERARPHGAADDLRGAGLRQRAHPDDPVGLERLAEHVGDRGRDLRLVRLGAGSCDAEDPGNLALDV